MLSRDEQRQLAEIERRLRREDPALDHRLARGLGRKRARRRRVAIALGAFATLCVLLGLLVSEGTVVLGGVALFSLAVWMVGDERRPPDHWAS